MTLTSVSVHVAGQSALVWTASVTFGTAVSFSFQVDHSAVTFQAGLELELLLTLDTLKVSSLKHKIKIRTMMYLEPGRLRTE